MGAKGSSSIGDDTANPFRTTEGWNEFHRRMTLLHGLATKGQTAGIIREVQEWESHQLVSFDQEQEYHETLRAQELYEKLIQEGD